MASKKSIYSGLLFLTLGALVPVTSYADDGIATDSRAWNNRLFYSAK